MASSAKPLDAASSPLPPPRASLRVAAFEVAWIFLVFFLFAGSPPPGVGESHYLPKAKHYWQPEWCAGDSFLESPDAHVTFNWTFGWVTKFVSMTAAAWIGRAITWLLLAWSWRRLSWAVVPRPLYALLSAGLMLLFLRNFHMAGEWIVGGVEAKGFAYVLVFLALEAIVRGSWRVAFLLAGAAGAFHVLVGGWTVVAIGLAWLASWKDRPSLMSLIPALIGGFVLSLPGLLPALALNRGVPDEVTREASRIYVFDRLSHHLVFHEFEPIHQARYGLLLLAWLPLAWSMRRHAGERRLQLVIAGALVIALLGVLIDQSSILEAQFQGRSIAEYELRAAPLLRYYWFRMSDSLLPIGVALAATSWIARLHAAAPQRASWLLILAILAAAANIADVCYWRSQQRLPGAILQPRPTADSAQGWWFSQPPASGRINSPSAAEWAADWQAACAWIAENTPPDAKFMTPRGQQTFKWYAGRAEVATWKDVPQDAQGLVAWKEVLSELHPRDREHRLHGLAAFSDDVLIALAHKHGATHIVIDRTRANRPIALPRVYPLFREENPSFDVYRVPEMQVP
jgi:hypothetical protein